ncbi:M20 family metallopeptidase [Paenibacillus validus]|uniref:M20 metallopeptidase family protein n=1 Tax=Paenibacillus validus TaxID=44253 RepID=UPI000FD90813|nr:M20 family metallopeptidase [Paenibacillus validus]MED4600797.1 M20 family metallopeptidase [Paenibacillus validus]MED4606928.1 M20 family metallopeptidase [Paenibacillus validus]
MNMNETLESVFPEMIEWRRHMHRNPELSYYESETAAYVAERLLAWGLEVRTFAGKGHGVVARLEGRNAGPTVALRADMDALPIQDEKACEYASTVPGVMHACGHDAHTSTLLAVAKTLSRHRDSLNGTVVFLFQPAEETTPGGALGMIEDGALDGVDVVYGIHLWTPFEVGTAACKPGPMMAAADEFVIEIKGKGGHGGLPHEAIDSVFVASQLVVNLQSIVSRSADPTEPCVVSVGSIHGGTTFNVIAEMATLKGTVRTFHPDLRSMVKDRLETIVRQTCLMHGATYTLDYKMGYPPVINHAEEADRFLRTAPQTFGEAGTKLSPLIMAGEDYAYYLEQIPGCFMFVGAGNRERGIVYPHHHPRFDIDENAMLHAAKLFVSMTLDYMNEYRTSR